MVAFRFRAQPALDLRRREYDAAQRELARADAERQRARHRVEAAARALAEARHDADSAAGRVDSTRELEWYRFWIVRLEQEHTALRAAERACDAAVAVAQAACLTARQRRDALERLRDKAWRTHAAAEAAADRKAIDELATQRYARRDMTKGA